jgi:dipeptidyl aminopeptidase/acylaminoacyl peptidase
MNLNRLLAAAAISAASVVASSVLAQTTAPEIPVETLFRKTEYRQLTFSPDQKYLAALLPLNSRYNLAVVDLEKRQVNRLTSFPDGDVTSYFWASNDRILFTTGDLQSLDLRGDGGLFAVDRDGSNMRTLVEPFRRGDGRSVARVTTVLGRIKGSAEEVLVSANDRSADTQDVYRMNVRNGRKTLISFDSPGLVQRWVLDKNNVPRAAMSVDWEKRRYWFSWRADDKSPWKTVAQWDEQLKDVIIPRYFDPADDSKMYVVSNSGRDTLAFFKFDPATGKLGELVFGDDRYDVGAFGLVGGNGGGGSLVFGGSDEDPGKLLGVRYTADKPKVVWFDESARKQQAMLEASFPNATVTFNPARKRGLVTVRSDVNPGEFFIYDQEKRTLEEMGVKPAAWINPKQMAPKLPVTWTARDGMRIDGYLTLPQGFSKGKPVALVLHPHGGPWARDNWEYNPEVQFMANRGYAVLQPNFRGSTGYGTRHLKASYKTWGDAMIDDMIDGVEWAIKEGYADKDKLAVYGASYGGYATLMALVKRPDLFKWGINYVGVTDMAVHQDTQPAQRRGDFGPLAKVINGDQNADAEMFQRTSPARHVDRIKAPVMHAYGGEDRNVDIANGNTIKSAFDKAGKPYEWMFVADEFHGYVMDKNVFDYYNRFDKFMKRHLPLK